MDARLVKILLRCVQSGDERFTTSIALNAFVSEYGARVGERKGQSVYMTLAQKQAIRELLASDGVNASTPPDAWSGLTRAEALELGNNEKFAQDPVRRRRVAVKALRPSWPLILNGNSIFLPARCHVEVDYAEIGAAGQHDWIVVVENWECFNDIHLAADKLEFPGVNPLVVWRGEKDGTRSDGMLAMVRAMSQPVAAFVDYDPAGMVIARSLPRLSYFVSPSIEVLTEMIKDGLEIRYTTQIAQCQQSLSENDLGCLAAAWGVIRRSGRGLPQEWFVLKDIH